MDTKMNWEDEVKEKYSGLFKEEKYASFTKDELIKLINKAIKANTANEDKSSLLGGDLV